MTDYRKCLLAALKRRELVSKQLRDASAISTTHDLIKQRGHLDDFINYCRFAMRFEQGKAL